MSFSELFIRRPVATTLLTLGIVLAGMAAFRLLPVSPLPQVDFPTIAVSAGLPGASPETMAATVATPLERALGRIAGITEMTSSSSLGSTTVVLQFDLNRNIDGAARDVQAAINAARSLLPTGLPNNPTYRKVNPADAPIMILSLSSESLTPGRMYDVASTILAQKLAQVQGIGQVRVGGSSLPAVRVELNPSALTNMGVSLEDVRQAVAASNANRPKGMLESGELSWQVGANDQARTAADYLPLVVAYRNGAAVRLADVADVVDSVEDVRNAGAANGKRAVLLIMYRQPGANIIETVERVRALLPSLRAAIPGAVDLQVMMDRTSTIRASLAEVERSLLISVGLVILVVFLFLGDWRATLVPAVGVPASLVGSFGVMYLCGYSLDNLSLMALTIATGFVVDDAIVVLENISRHVEAGMRPFQAAIKGAAEVGFTVVSISISLVAVFIPILFMGGIIGRLFREFAVTLSVAIMVSLIISLTTTPMLCARVLGRQGHGSEPRPPAGRWSLWALRDGLMDTLTRGYDHSLQWCLRHGLITMLLLVATVALNVHLYAIVPKGFFPQQDTGRLIGSIQADQAISFQALQTKLFDFMRVVQADPATSSVMAFTGGGQRNSGVVFVSLKPKSQRRESADQVIGRLRGKLAKVPGASLYLQAVQDIRMGGRPGGGQYQFTLQGDDLAELRSWEPRIRQAMTQLPGVTDVNSDQQVAGQQAYVTLDRATAARLGLTTRVVMDSLNDAFGQRQVSTIFTPMNQYRVVLEYAPPFTQSPESLDTFTMVGPTKGQIPLRSVAALSYSPMALSVNHQGQFTASTISFNLTAGKSLSDATEGIKRIMREMGVPGSVRGSFQGTAKAFQDSLGSMPWLILAALGTLYIVLGILYESYVHPVTILSTLPSAGVGALLALMAFDMEFSVIALIGVLLLAGIVKKNAIMMIDFALERERHEGLSPREAIHKACLLRFRPIMMTTMAALLGALPLALGSGEGAELRRPLGVSIVGGLMVSQVLTLYTTPVLYVYIDRFRLWAQRVWGSKDHVKLEA